MFNYLIGLTLILILVIRVIYYKIFRDRPKRPIDYFALFVIGITWIGAGVPLLISTNNPGFIGMGVVFTILGLANKNKWKENRRRFSELDDIEKKFKIFVIIALFVLLIIGFSVNILLR
ncbi:MAG: hypothetical protein JW702_11385 [Clostridiales bacterium]|nr:hypothetical protein [Clostridiales bacterium]